jgi:thiol-disulfide isomerase/thioredoxin
MRTRLLKGDEENLFALVQLKEHKIPRSLVQRVVWLPPAKGTKKDEQTPAAEKQPVSITGVSSRGTAQAIIDDSLRVTMQLEGLADGKLIGESSVLGDCNVAIDRLIELRLGGLEVEDAHKVAVAQWRLQDAIDPIYMQDQELAENGRMTAGLNFPLVGKAAPDFTAPTLSGDAVQLSGLRGRVVVLDFWASWCGPCIQAFPEIVSLADSYDDDKVQLISVNMGEDKESMVACLERLKLSPTVAMDEQGRVADQYLVESIPQTVVISPKGEVARVFVGSTPNLQKQLRFAIDELLAP